MNLLFRAAAIAGVLHITPAVVLVKRPDAVLALLPGAEAYFAREVHLSNSDAHRLHLAVDWSPEDGVLTFYGGKTGSTVVGSLEFVRVDTPHGPIEVAVGFTPDGTVRGVIVTKATVEMKPWVLDAVGAGRGDRRPGRQSCRVHRGRSGQGRGASTRGLRDLLQAGEDVNIARGSGVHILMMRLIYLGVALVAAGSVACAGPELAGNRGIAIGHTGGGGSDVLVFRVQPSNVTAGNVMTPAVQVQVQDTLGNPDTSFTASVTVAIGTNPVGGTLGGTKSVAPVNGIALFGDLSVNKAGTGYTLTATAPGATGATSAAFDVVSATGSAPAR